MIELRGRRNGVRLIALSVLGLAGCLSAMQAKAANSLYFDTNGTTAGYGVASGGVYSWDSANWAAASGGTTATSTWVAGDFARFYGGASGNTYTVTVSNDESMAGLYLNVSGVTLNINQASGTSGDLNIVSAGTPAYQGFLITGSASTVIINAPITGAGGIEQEVAGSLALYGNNSYTGGTETTGGQVLYYNNNNSFGTGSVTLTGTGAQAFVNNGPAGVTIANNFIFTVAGTADNFAGGNPSGSTPGTNFTGTFTLPTTGTTTLNTSSVTTNVTEISGVISGASNINVADVGTLMLAGANAYTGTTAISGTATLKLAAAGTIASSSEVILSGGTLNPDGINQAMSATTLGLTASSTIDFGVGASEVDFANSAGLSWTGTLNLANFNPAVDFLRFGTGPGGLTSAQLAAIKFNGSGAGTATLDANGFLVQPAAAAPEPAMLLPLLGAGLVLVRRRRVRN